jgi:hypothetical protein
MELIMDLTEQQAHLQAVADTFNRGSQLLAEAEVERAEMGWQRFMVNLPDGTSGDWTVEQYTVTQQEEDFQRLRCALNPQRGARWVPAGTYTRLLRGGTIVMSDTPDEIKDHMEPIERATGHCIVAGLGLGMVAEAMLRKPEVTKVTVLEMSPDVAKLVGEPLQERWGDRLEVIVTDALEWRPPKDANYGVAWFDIWDNISEDNLVEMTKFKRRYARKAAWKGCWAEHECRGQRRRVARGEGWY